MGSNQAEEAGSSKDRVGMGRNKEVVTIVVCLPFFQVWAWALAEGGSSKGMEEAYMAAWWKISFRCYFESFFKELLQGRFYKEAIIFELLAYSLPYLAVALSVS